MLLPTATGTQIDQPRRNRRGQPLAGLSALKSIGILDWDLGDYGATLTGRYISKLRESDGNVMNPRISTDLQLRWTPVR